MTPRSEHGGLSFIEADNIDAAVELAKTCPQLGQGGSIEVAELVDRHHGS